MMSHADVLAAFGDPELAVAAADTAIAMYLKQAERVNTSPDFYSHARSMVQAIDVAVIIHKAHGRDEVAAEAAEIASRIDPRTSDGQPVDLPSPFRNIPAFNSASLALTVGAALDRAAVLLGGDRVSEALRRMAERAGAVTAAGEIIVPAGLIPADLSTPDLLPVFASEIAGLAADLIPLDEIAGLRLGLEAHYMFWGGRRCRSISCGMTLVSMGSFGRECR